MILHACPDCDRQYDVTGLSPGRRVRCICERVFTVGLPQALSVRGRKCTLCGGPAENADETCSYCGAGLAPWEQEKGTLCPGCRTRLEDTAKHCSGCGIEIRPQALASLPEAARCPRCTGELRIRLLPEDSVVECAGCAGLWVQPETFDRVCTEARRRPEFALIRQSEPAAVLEPEAEVRYIPCVTCQERMQRRMFRYRGLPSRVVLDICRDHGVWLDRDELERIVAFIRTRGVSTPAIDVARRRVTSESHRPALPAERGGEEGSLFWALGFLGEAIGEILSGLLD